MVLGGRRGERRHSFLGALNTHEAHVDQRADDDFAVALNEAGDARLCGQLDFVGSEEFAGEIALNDGIMSIDLAGQGGDNDGLVLRRIDVAVAHACINLH